MLFDEGSLDAPSEIRLSEKLIAKILPAREYAADLMDGATSLADAIGKIKKQEATLIDHDPSFVCDISYMQNYALKKLRSDCDGIVLRCFSLLSCYFVAINNV